MNQLGNALLAIDTAHIAPQRVLDGRPSLVGLNQVYGLNHPNSSV